MKKRYIVAIAALGIFIAGIIGSYYTCKSAVIKLDTYLENRSAQLFKTKEVFSTSEKINRLDIGNIAYYAQVNIKKSPDSRSKVIVKNVEGRDDYNVTCKGGILTVDAKKDVADHPLSVTNKNFTVEKGLRVNLNGKTYPFFMVPESVIREQLDQMAVLSGGRKLVDFMDDDDRTADGDRSTAKGGFSVDIEIPSGVDISFNGNSDTAYLLPGSVNIEDKMVRDRLTMKSGAYIRYLNYPGKIKNIDVDFTSQDIESDNNIDLSDFAGLKAEKLNLKVKPGMSVGYDGEYMKIADEIDISAAGKKLPYDESMETEGRFTSEKNLGKYIKELSDADGYSDISEDYKKKIDSINRSLSKVDRMKDMFSVFSDVSDMQKDDNSDNMDEYEMKVDRAYYEKYDLSVNTGEDICDRLRINTPDLNVRMNIMPGYNPDMKISTKDGVDFRMYLVENIPVNRIIQVKKEKQYNGNIESLVKKADSDFRMNVKSRMPSVDINSKSAVFVSDEQ